MGRYTDLLFSQKNIFDTEATDGLFLKAMRENCLWHYRHCPEYRRILDSFRFSPYDLRKYEDIEKLPFIPTAFLKTHRMFSMPKALMPIRVTSSGTSGKMSEIGLDTASLLNGLKMVIRAAEPRGLISGRPCHFIVFGYRPDIRNRTAVSKTAFGYTFFSPAIDRTYALKPEKSSGGIKYFPDLDGVIKAIVKNSRSSFPTRFIGFPAYTYFTLRSMEQRGISVKLPEGSSIMLGGGWKQFYKERADKKELYRLAEKQLGIPESYISESFGAAEHPILYIDCEKHSFHIPVYSRVIIRDVNTLKPLKKGETGLVNLITPMISATPVLSILTDDLGVLRDGGECGCGIRSPYLEIIGRVGLKEIKTCAAGAAELLSGGAYDTL